jgi:hypothetical protein
MTFVVKTKDDLWNLLQPESPWHPFRRPRPLIRIPELPPQEARAWEQRLDTIRQQCGCTSGALAMAAFALLFAVYSLRDLSSAAGSFGIASFAWQGTLLVAGLIASALMGKFLGLLSASIQFRRTCFDLHQRLHMKTMIVPQSVRSCCQNRPIPYGPPIEFTPRLGKIR